MRFCFLLLISSLVFFTHGCTVVGTITSQTANTDVQTFTGLSSLVTFDRIRWLSGDGYWHTHGNSAVDMIFEASTNGGASYSEFFREDDCGGDRFFGGTGQNSRSCIAAAFDETLGSAVQANRIRFRSSTGNVNQAMHSFGSTSFQLLLCGPGVSGDPVFSTFNHLTFDYTGICPVELVADCESNKFKVVSHSTPCGLTSCLESLSVSLGATSIQMKLGPELVVDGQEVDVSELMVKPLQVSGGKIEMLPLKKQVAGASSLLRLSTGVGLVVDWSGVYWGFSHIRLAESLRGKTCGVMGRHGENNRDGLYLRDGSKVEIAANQIEGDRWVDEEAVDRFVSNWVVPNHAEGCKKRVERVASNCGSPQRKKHIKAICERMIRVGNVQEECQNNKTEEKLVEQCENATCSCFRLEENFLECVQWAVRDLQRNCLMFPEEIGFETAGEPEALAL